LANPLAAAKRAEITQLMRIHPVRSYLVVYDAGDVYILRVRHVHKDLV